MRMKKTLAAASALALARGLGEFGATLLFAGSLQGVTQTLPLAIYSQFEVDLDTALAIGCLFVLFGAALLLTIKLLPGWIRFARWSSICVPPSIRALMRWRFCRSRAMSMIRCFSAGEWIRAGRTTMWRSRRRI